MPQPWFTDTVLSLYARFPLPPSYEEGGFVQAFFWLRARCCSLNWRV